MYLDGFETERLIIRQLNERDIAVWTDYFLDQESFEFIGLDRDTSPCDLSKDWIQRQIKRYSEEKFGLMALIDKEEMVMVGQCGLITMNVESDNELEIGYHIIDRYRRKGYAFEAASFFKNWVFENGLADTLLSVIHVDNTVSQKLVKKLGMRRERETVCMKKPCYRYIFRPDK
jgi:RimJ/RimL family protein N-acetyltransferase